jgi:restriction system protein
LGETIATAVMAAIAGFVLLFVIALIIGLTRVLVVGPIRKLVAAESLQLKIEDAVQKHLRVLIRKRSQTDCTDDYGRRMPDKWHKEIRYFVGRELMPSLRKLEQTALERNFENVVSRIDDIVLTAIKSSSMGASFSDTMSPPEFEQFCAAELHKAGWQSRVKGASGDQGVDVIAEKRGIRVVLQCKLHGRPVGNKAVQEVYAAQKFERADYAAVVSNADYTPKARELASSNGVLLLHYNDLPTLSSQLDRVSD